MSNVVDHDAEALQRSHAKQSHVARLGKDDFIVRFVAFGAENSVTHLTFDLLLHRGREHPFSTRCDTTAVKTSAGSQVSSDPLSTNAGIG